jgi:C-terminal processing protease CtpA/Prc
MEAELRLHPCFPLTSPPVFAQDDEECGIGIKVKQSKGRYQVVEVAEGGPSFETGQIFVGDSVFQIDGTLLGRE